MGCLCNGSAPGVAVSLYVWKPTRHPLSDLNSESLHSPVCSVCDQHIHAGVCTVGQSVSQVSGMQEVCETWSQVNMA